MSTLNKLPIYWKQRLIAEDGQSPKCPSKDDDGEVVENRKNLIAGLLGGKKLDFFRRLVTDGKDGGRAFPMDVLVAPWVWSQTVEGADEIIRPVPVYWIPAKLHENGRIMPYSVTEAFINSALLFSPDAPSDISLIERDDYLERTTNKHLHDATWGEICSHLCSDFRTVFDEDLNTWSPEGSINRAAVIMLDSGAPGFNRHLSRILDNACEPDANAILFERAISSGVITASQVGEENRLVGAYPREQALNHAQQSAATAVGALSEGEILAVNGPPGTGKTSMLSEIFADTMVRSTVEGKAAPIIVIASTNNQAVTNALSSLCSIESSTDIVAKRWLGHDLESSLESYVAWVPSEGALQRKENRKYSSWAFEGIVARIFDDIFPEEALSKWRESFRQWNERQLSSLSEEVCTVKEAVSRAYTKVQNLSGLADYVADFVDNRNSVEELQERSEYLCQVNREADEQIRELDAKHKSRKQKAADALRQLENLQNKVKKHHDQWVKMVANKGQNKLLDTSTARMMRREITLSHPELEVRLSEGMAPSEIVATIENHVSNYRGKANTIAHSELASLLNQRDEIQSELTSLRSEIAKKVRWSTWLNEAKTVGQFRRKNDRQIMADIEQGLKEAKTNLFNLCMRYREGEFALRANKLEFRRTASMRNLSRTEKQRLLRDVALLYPVFAGTVFKIASLFSYSASAFRPFQDKSLIGEIDLLVLDEAGQISPHKGMPMLALAKKAVVVGDTKQLQPVSGISVDLDRISLSQHYADDTVNALCGSGYDVAEGSMMKIAQLHTRFTSPETDQPGMLLNEHFRCSEPIIKICNRMAYRGRLIPKRFATDTILPSLAFGHVRGKAKKVAGSWENEIEANTIVDWIVRHRDIISKRYGNVSGHVAIVTPFKRQERLLRRVCNKILPPEDRDIVVGTVNTLQGAERTIVIFSPTITKADYTVKPGMDRKPNLINVAVSRARDCFAVIGDMNAIRGSHPGSPLGILSHHILSYPGSELPGFSPVYGAKSKTVERLLGAKQHDQTLIGLLEKAKSKVLVSSLNCYPDLEQRQEFFSILLETARRGVKVYFAVGMTNSFKEERFRKTLADFEKAGATIVCDSMWHTKTALVDDDAIIEGSFNWLTAKGGTGGFTEASLFMHGWEAKEFVEAAWQDLSAIVGTRISTTPVKSVTKPNSFPNFATRRPSFSVPDRKESS
ncbi:hypothetical protein HFO56_39215 [Rhizobium laguerreae]|uniref:AAA domain-containing protein n=1 Tax=Rhizobium laguerreae TaxID=1076926 RepID=UPI001C8FB96E|nr:AAA domain-containing protein [Rhizobium laguerreae]MBY3158331.1 hypothetical protein [Rhizobium laguerreae]